MSEMMKALQRRRTTSRHIYKIALFGATGKTGSLFLEKALLNNHTITCFVRNKDKLERQVSKYKREVKERAKQYLTIIECDIFDPAAIAKGLTGINVVLSTLNFHRRNNKGWTIDLYQKWTEMILEVMKDRDVFNILALMSWYTDDKGSDLKGGLSGCGARFFLRHMIGHVLDDMNAAVEVLEKSENIHWNTIHAPGLRKGDRLEKEIISNSSDRVQAIIDKYPFYKTRYHTMRFADVACYLLDVIENKVNLPENRKIAISYKHSLAEPEFNTL